MISSVGGHSVELVAGAMPPELVAGLPDPAERAHVADVSGRDDTATLLVRDRAGELVGYAVIGRDEAGAVAVYAARAIGGGFIVKAALVGLFGAAQVIGAPLRFHVEDMRGRLRAAARMMGAPDFSAALDADGIPQGVFRGV